MDARESRAWCSHCARAAGQRRSHTRGCCARPPRASPKEAVRSRALPHRAFKIDELGAEASVDEKPSCASSFSTGAATNEAPPSVSKLRLTNDQPRGPAHHVHRPGPPKLRAPLQRENNLVIRQRALRVSVIDASGCRPGSVIDQDLSARSAYLSSMRVGQEAQHITCIAPVPQSCAHHCSARTISSSASERSAYRRENNLVITDATAVNADHEIQS